MYKRSSLCLIGHALREKVITNNFLQSTIIIIKGMFKIQRYFDIRKRYMPFAVIFFVNSL